MAMTPGLSANLRQMGLGAAEAPLNDDDVTVEIADGEGDKPQMDDNGDILRIEHDDGSITISMDGKSLNEAEGDANPKGWFDNLVDDIDDLELGRISADLMRGDR